MEAQRELRLLECGADSGADEVARLALHTLYEVRLVGSELRARAASGRGVSVAAARVRGRGAAGAHHGGVADVELRDDEVVDG